MDKILLTTGGTGGHIFPALAVAEELRRRTPGARLLFVGSEYGPEARLCARAGIEFAGLPVRGFLGRGLRAVGAAARMSVAVGKALSLVRGFRPDAVAGFGGYAAFAPMLAARLCGVPAVLHEQNAVAGTSNRVLARLARRVCVSLPGTQGFPAEKCVLTGNPVRAAIAGVADRRKDAATRGTKRLLVLGGSQGAHSLNRLLPGLLAELKAAGVEIRHQCGGKDLDATRAAYAEAGYAPDCVSAFIDDMAEAYAWADLALCRAGASTVAELCAGGVPSVLVPFPAAIHDHQTRNAEVVAQAGAGRLVQERDFPQTGMAALLLGLLADPAALAAMGRAARGLSRTDAAAAVADALTAVAR
ncbi:MULTISPECIES: undecaprenyldiphospho-muramoylpentapeptide beta-N-acetylglucosaminyltransferase [unclassified Desulfovibrio]|uniref:undecaprenyldiphospho-muramoylpentapeptide beta-N-acetylglucosaminyltransferase n=1 Tax=unclassified Desulfovibrio TaxID=2593640 RepID=UPI0013EB87DB|nr:MULTISPECIES: undecaprenyldiphospho-muramoylpentapeptide beta-N-acetylglucosaminyltransferase [unclassified Desulfovibrio]